MTTIPIGSTNPTTTPQASASASSNSGLNQLDNTQTFLMLLVAQLKNQDPDNPTDPSAFMSEIAQLSSTEAQSNTAADEQVVAADTMIGQDVTGPSAGSSTISGVVTGVTLSSGGSPTLQIGSSGQQLSLSSITQVTAAAPPSSASGATGGSGSAGSGTGGATGGTSGSSGGSG